MIDVEQFISKRNELLSCSFSNQDKVLHILLCFDNNYALSAGVDLISVIENNHNQDIHFHMFTHNVSDENRHRFGLIKADNVSITEYIINDKFKIDTKNTEQFPISACVRLIAPIVLKNITSRLLYIDSDTLCIGSLTSIFDINLENKIVAAVADAQYMQESQCSKYNVILGTYFNSGVMVINIDMWCQNNITVKALKLLNGEEKFSYPDQDVLNIIVGEKRVLIGRIFNNLLGLSPNGNEDSNVPKDTVLIHYVTKNKPWHQPYRTTLFDSYLSISPWCNDPLPRYEGKKTSSVRQYSRLMYQQGHYLTAIKYYFVYLKKKGNKNKR